MNTNKLYIKTATAKTNARLNNIMKNKNVPNIISMEISATKFVFSQNYAALIGRKMAKSK